MLHWNFDNSWHTLPGRFFTAMPPVAVQRPGLLLFNERLAAELGLLGAEPPAEPTDRPQNAAESPLGALFAGNRVPEGAEPLAQAYAGHQFGHFTMLGDGRAILLGEHLAPDGRRVDVQLKGSGRTPYSRRGDGRATLYSMLREYLMGEAMHALGIPSSRGLAVATTGESVYRETTHEGAVFTRVASSHIRVGSFEYARHVVGEEAVAALLEYTVSRHYPELLPAQGADASGLAIGLLQAVCERQAQLVSEWMRVGFIHGVMNTDNMSLSGETFDYGPCAFMNAYDPATVFSSIDAQGRYAFGNQPRAAHWNLAVLAGALLPAMDPDENRAVELAKPIIDGFADRFQPIWYSMMLGKLGIVTDALSEADRALVDDLLGWMKEHKADYTNTFLRLGMALSGRSDEELDTSGQEAASNDAGNPERAAAYSDSIHSRSSGASTPIHPYQTESFAAWQRRWQERLSAEPGGFEQAQARMARVNPAVIPRNHLVEEALTNAVNGDFSSFDALLETLRRPYRQAGEAAELQDVPQGFDAGYATFCGT